MSTPQYVFEALGRHHNRAAFSCGVDALDVYFHQYARQHMEKRVAAVFVLHDVTAPRVVGYYTLSVLSIYSGDIPPELAATLPRYPELPTTLLGRLAVDERYRGQGFGGRLLLDALRRAYNQREVATLAVVVDAKDDTAAAFYQRYGFRTLPDRTSRLILPMATIEQLFRQPG